MSPVQIWVLALDVEVMDRLFNNADSFAMAFDDAWKKLAADPKLKEHSIEKKTTIILENHIADHPFLLDNPEQARQVAQFRIRLLDLA